MSLSLRWVDDSELPRVIEARQRSFGFAARDFDRYGDDLLNDQRRQGADYLLAERDGRVVGTTTGLPLTMWVRGARLGCQGVAYVGTLRTERRRGGGAAGSAGSAGSAGAERGIASQLMDATVRKARERRQPVSALMPFRASFYEHFGYGLVETRCEWNVPTGLLPAGDFAGYRFMEEADVPRVLELCHADARAGRCDIETHPSAFTTNRKWLEDGLCFVDEAEPDGPLRGWCFARATTRSDRRVNDVVEWAVDSPASLLRLLHWASSQKDQFPWTRLTLPAHVPLNWLLRERHLVSHAVEHATAELRAHSRMMLRVIDHVAFFKDQRLPAPHGAAPHDAAPHGAAATVGGAVTVAVHETEGEVSKFRLEVGDGRLDAAPSQASADVECRDVVWAAVAAGELRASDAARFGLLDVRRPDLLPLLDALAEGPRPFCKEYF